MQFFSLHRILLALSISFDWLLRLHLQRICTVWGSGCNCGCVHVIDDPYSMLSYECVAIAFFVWHLNTIVNLNMLLFTLTAMFYFRNWRVRCAPFISNRKQIFIASYLRCLVIWLSNNQFCEQLMNALFLFFFTFKIWVNFLTAWIRIYFVNSLFCYADTVDFFIWLNDFIDFVYFLTALCASNANKN